MLENRDPSGGESHRLPDSGRSGSDSVEDALEAGALQVLRDQQAPLTVRDVQVELQRRWARPLPHTAVADAVDRLVHAEVVRCGTGQWTGHYSATGATRGRREPQVFVDERQVDPQLLRRLQRFLRDEP